MKKLFYLLFTLAILSAHAQTRTYYGQATYDSNGMPVSSGTVFKFVKVVYDDDTPSNLIRGGSTFKLYYTGDDGDFEKFSTNNPYFTFAIKEDCVIEWYSMNGITCVSVYGTNANSSNNSGSNGGYYNGNIGGYNSESSNGGKTRCYSCYGSGKCQNCNGTGQYEPLRGSVWGARCRVCNGTTRCVGCDGKGYY